VAALRSQKNHKAKVIKPLKALQDSKALKTNKANQAAQISITMLIV
jgi:hypothetical protein